MIASQNCIATVAQMQKDLKHAYLYYVLATGFNIPYSAQF